MPFSNANSFIKSNVFKIHGSIISCLYQIKSACSRLWRKLARQIAVIFIESKAVIRKNAMRARARANLCNNSGWRNRGSICFYLYTSFDQEDFIPPERHCHHFQQSKRPYFNYLDLELLCMQMVALCTVGSMQYGPFHGVLLWSPLDWQKYTSWPLNSVQFVKKTIRENQVLPNLRVRFWKFLIDKTFIKQLKRWCGNYPP